MYIFLGYSSTSGYFYDLKTLWYASGVPRADQVLTYDFSNNAVNRALDVHQRLRSTQLGEYFGASITAGDINGDGFDDLVVGAPFFGSKCYNQGRVYVFLGGRTVSWLKRCMVRGSNFCEFSSKRPFKVVRFRGTVSMGSSGLLFSFWVILTMTGLGVSDYKNGIDFFNLSESRLRFFLDLCFCNLI